MDKMVPAEVASHVTDEAKGLGSACGTAAPARPPRRHPRHRRDRSAALEAADRWLLRTVDAAVAAAAVGVPLTLGGRIALGQSLLVTCAFLAAAAWCARQALRTQATWYRSPAEWLFLAAMALVAVQWIPLPTSWLRALSPNLFETLPLWSPDTPGRLGEWATLSLAPADTRAAFVLLAAGGVLLLTAIQRLAELADVERLLRLMAAVTVGVAVLAVLHYFAGNGKYYGFYRYPYVSPDQYLLGSFTNRNHFAQFVMLGLGPLAWCIHRSLGTGSRDEQMGKSLRKRSPATVIGAVLWSVAAAGTVFTGLMSLSRGGGAAMLLAGLVLLLILARTGLAGGRLVATLSLVGVLLAASLWVYGYDRLTARLEDFASIQTLDRFSARRSIWKANLETLQDFPLTGTGLATHQHACPIHLQGQVTSMGVVATHAESSYLQVASELGIPGVLTALAAVGWGAACCLSALRGARSRRMVLAVAAIVPGLIAHAVHASVDYLWYVPGCMVPVILLAAAAIRLAGAGRTGAVPPAAWAAGAAALLMAGGVFAWDRGQAALAERHWHQFVLLERAARDGKPASRETLEAMVRELKAAIGYQPQHAAARTWLAKLELRGFDSVDPSAAAPFDLAQVRQVALSSGFTTRQALNDWLDRAFPGKRQHLEAAQDQARRALALSPLDGQNYLILSELAFLDGPAALPSAAYVDQALRLRPSDGEILLAAGYEAALAGDAAAQIALWQRAYRLDSTLRKRVMTILIDHVPVRQLVEWFQPDRHICDWLAAVYTRRGLAADAEFATQCCAAAAVAAARAGRGKGASEAWWQAAEAYRRLGDPARQTEALQAAIVSDFSNYNAHRTLGLLLDRAGRYDEAKRHLNWCLRTRPDDADVLAALEKVIEGQLRQQAESAAARPAWME